MPLTDLIAHLHLDGTIQNETRRQWIAELERLQAACAEMRGILEDAMIPWSMGKVWKVDTQKLTHALSLDCEKDYVPRAELERLKHERNRIGMEVRAEWMPKVKVLREALDGLFITCVEMVNDHRKGDFSLCKLAECDLGAICDKLPAAKQALALMEEDSK